MQANARAFDCKVPCRQIFPSTGNAYRYPGPQYGPNALKRKWQDPCVDCSVDPDVHSPPAVPLVGESAPEIGWTDEHGRATSLHALRGKPVLLAFFADGWDPARRECLAQYEAVRRCLPGGAKLVAAEASGVHFTFDDSDGGALAFAQAPDGSADNQRNAARFGVEGMQAVFLIDATGIVRWRNISPPGVQPALHALLDAIEDPQFRQGVTRREFLLTAVALAVAAGVSPRWARAGDADVRVPAAARGRTTSLNVNGTDYRIDGDPRITLLDALRERIGLIGTKKSCDHGQCGACTVHMDGRRVNSCLVLARQAEGTQVVTIEGLAQGGRLHPMQAAFIEFDGFQCGYCTSGQIMSAVACVREGHARDRDQIQEWMSGNICRCGAYNGICSAIERTRGATGGRA